MSKAGRVLGMALACLGGALLAACGGGEGSPYEPPPLGEVHHVDVSPTVDTLKALGATRRYSAVGKTSDNRTVSNVTFTWRSTATGVATVDDNGLVTAVGNGTATIQATGKGVTGSASAVVVQVAVTMDLSPTPVGLAPSETVQLEATAEDANGNSITGPSVEWASSNQSVATVNANGLVTGLAEGQATITAESGTASADATITVLSAGLVTIRDLVSDTFVDHLIGYLETSTAAQLEIAMRDMLNALGEGDQAGLDTALTAAQSIVDAGSPDDAVLLAYLDLILDYCRNILDQL